MPGLLLALTVPVTAVALLYARREYRRRGRLTLRGTALLCGSRLFWRAWKNTA